MTRKPTSSTATHAPGRDINTYADDVARLHARRVKNALETLCEVLTLATNDGLIVSFNIAPTMESNSKVWKVTAFQASREILP